MFKRIGVGMIALMFVFGPQTALLTQAQALSESEMSLLIQLLMAQIQQQTQSGGGGASVVVPSNGVRLQVGSRGADVRELQHYLYNEGLYPEAIFSGYYGQLTENAVEKLRDRYDLGDGPGFDTDYYGEITAIKNFSENYLEWVNNSLGRDSFKIDGNLDFTMGSDGSGTESIEARAQARYEFEADVTEREMRLVVSINAIVDYGLFTQPLEIAFELRYVDDSLFLIIYSAPDDFVGSDMRNQWIELNVRDLLGDEGIDIDSVWSEFGELLREELENSNNRIGNAGIFIVNPNTAIKDSPASEYDGENVSKYNIKINTNAFADYLKDFMNAELFSEPGVAPEFSNDDIDMVANIYGFLFDHSEMSAWVLDNYEVVANEFEMNLDIDRDVLMELSEIAGEPLSVSEAEEITDEIGILTIEVSVSDLVTMIGEDISVSKPRNIINFFDLWEEYNGALLDVIDLQEDVYDDNDGEEMNEEETGGEQGSAENIEKILNINTIGALLDQDAADSGEYFSSRYDPNNNDLRDAMDALSISIDLDEIFDNDDYHWENNSRDSSKYCVWVELTDNSEYNFFAESDMNYGMTDEQPSLNDCVH